MVYSESEENGPTDTNHGGSQSIEQLHTVRQPVRRHEIFVVGERDNRCTCSMNTYIAGVRKPEARLVGERSPETMTPLISATTAAVSSVDALSTTTTS